MIFRNSFLTLPVLIFSVSLIGLSAQQQTDIALAHGEPTEQESESTADLHGAIKPPNATSFFWYVHPKTGERFFIDSPQAMSNLLPSVMHGTRHTFIETVRPALTGNTGKDSDADGIADHLEYALDLDPFSIDSDGDGYNDREEIQHGYQPQAGNGARFLDPEQVRRHAGLMYLDVDRDGRLWYIDHKTHHRHFISGMEEAFELLKRQAKTVETNTLKQIPVSLASKTWVTVPDGYTSRIVATGFARPRVLAFDPEGTLVVTEHNTDAKIYALLDRTGDGQFDTNLSIVDDKLYNGHGVAFADGKIFAAREHSIDAWDYDPEVMRATGEREEILELPPGSGEFPGQGHRTRTLQTGQDGKLYVAIGSNCDHCFGADKDWAIIKRLNTDGTHVETVAHGLRNTVFFDQNPQDGSWWGNDMGQDNLGDDYPPDEVNKIEPGNHYGWPYCVADRDPTPENSNPERCKETTPLKWSYGAHSAPLGIRFIPETFRDDWAGDLMVGLHGSTVKEKGDKRGYTVSRLEKEGDEIVGQTVFADGFLREEVRVGRPVDVIFDEEGRMYVSDDYANVVHVVEPS